MIVRKIKEWVKKPVFQWSVVTAFFIVVLTFGTLLFIQEDEYVPGVSDEERKELRLQEEIDSVIENQ